VVTVVALTTAVLLKLSVVRCDELPASALPASTSRGLVSIGVVMSPSAARPGEDYLPASYVNWIQSAGVVVVPIPSGVKWDKSNRSRWMTNDNPVWTPGKYEQVFRSINALVLPGGNPWPQVSSHGVRQLYSLALRANQDGNYFAVWGTCAGLESLLVLAAEGCESSIRDGNIPEGECAANGPVTRGFAAKNISRKFELSSLGETKMFNNAPSTLLQSIEQGAVSTFHYHSGGVTPEAFAGNHNISSLYRIVSTAKDLQGTEFVSTMEGQELPFYGVQYHPEKVLYEWGAKDGHQYEAIDHGAASIELAQYQAKFLAREARKNQHSYSSLEEQLSESIFNYVATTYRPAKPMYMSLYYANWTIE